LADGLRSAEDVNLACFRISRALEDISFSVPQAAQLSRLLLRTAGRIVIDTGVPGARAEDWTGTEEMVVQWLTEALQLLGREVVPGNRQG